MQFYYTTDAGKHSPESPAVKIFLSIFYAHLFNPYHSMDLKIKPARIELDWPEWKFSGDGLVIK
jgi:hypothetical protein